MLSVFYLKSYNNNILQIPCHKLHAANPNATPSNVITDIQNNLPPWIKPNAPATLYTSDMLKPKRGTLQLHQNNIWHFHTGRKNRKPPIPLPNFHTDLLHLINTSQLTQGHPPFRSYVVKKLITIQYVSTKDQLADIFTKPLPKDQFQKLRRLISGW